MLRMKKISFIIYHLSFSVALLLLLTSCNLFIDDELENQLMEYDGKGYDEVVTDSTDSYRVSYQYKKTTMELNADNPLTQHIVRVESIDSAGFHTIYFDGSTPVEKLPRVGQHIVSNNLDLFPYGLCDLVGIVEHTGGQHVVICKTTDVKDAFEYLSFHATMPVGNYFDEYDVYDADGDFLAHIDNREENARARAMTRSDEEGDDYIDVNVPVGLPPMEGAQLDIWKKKIGLPTNLQITANGKFTAKLYADCDFDWDKGLNCKFQLKEGCFTDTVHIVLTGGMSGPKKILGNDDLLNGKVRFNIGPVVVVPVFGFSLNFQIYSSLDATFTYTKSFAGEVGFWDGDFHADSKFEPDKIGFKLEAAANADIAILKLSLGFGLFTSDLSLRAEIYAKLRLKAAVSMDIGKFIEDPGDPVNIDFNPKVNLDFNIGFALSLVAKGAIIGKVLNKIKSHVKERSSFMSAMENFASNGTYTEWVALKNGEYVNPEVLAEMEKLLGNKTGKDREDLIDSWIKAKGKELSGIKGLSDKATNTELTGHVMEPGEGDDDKDFELRLGPFYPNLLKWTIFERYIFPKMKEGSFKVGQKRTSAYDPILFTGEWTLQNPGLFTFIKNVYPCFTIKSGDDELFVLFPENEEDAKITGTTPSGKRYTVEIPSLLEDETYTCIPGYALSYGGRPVMWDKGLAFSTTTPTIAITKFAVTSKEIKKIKEVLKERDNYVFKFLTYTSVTGEANIKEWGILDEIDSNPATRMHPSNEAALRGGSYIHYWTVNSPWSTFNIELRPYIFGRDATDLQDLKQATLFKTYKKELNYWDIDESRQATPQSWPADNSFGLKQNYILTLDSVTYEGKRIR